MDMGLMDLFQQGDMREKLYDAASRNNVPQGGLTGALFKAMFPHGAGNALFGRQPEPIPAFYSPEGTALMADLASNMMVPGTFIGPKGLARLFGDDAAKGILATAESKLASGVPKEAVFQELGVFKGPEGKWRYEIDDSGAQLGTMPTGKSWESYLRDAESDKYGRRGAQVSHMKKKEFNEYMKFRQSVENEYNTLNRRTRPLADAISHSELTNAYPDVSGINVEYIPDMGKSGAYMPEFDTIRFGDATNQDGTRGLFLHELQHAAQGREDFARGGSPQMFSSAADPMGEYLRLAGEAEARAVQDRMNMGMQERRALFPEYATRKDLIIRGLMHGFD